MPSLSPLWKVSRDMKRLVMICVLLAFGSAGEAVARHPHARFRTLRKPVVFHARPRMSYDELRAYLNCRYPRYVGGFHASYFRDMGLPPGDVGLRGNSLTLSPW